MIIRPVEPGDKAALRTFYCSRGDAHGDKLEWWIQRKAHQWAMTHPQHHVDLLIDDHDLIAGVYAFCPGGIIDSAGDPIAVDPDEIPIIHWFIQVVAVECQLGGNRYGSRLLMSCLARLAEIEPDGMAYWYVVDGNDASHAMSRSVGAEHEPAIGQTRYFIAL